MGGRRLISQERVSNRQTSRVFDMPDPVAPRSPYTRPTLQGVLLRVRSACKLSHAVARQVCGSSVAHRCEDLIVVTKWGHDFWRCPKSLRFFSELTSSLQSIIGATDTLRSSGIADPSAEMPIFPACSIRRVP